MTTTTIRFGTGRNDRVRILHREDKIKLWAKPGALLTPEQAMSVADALVDHAEALDTDQPSPAGLSDSPRGTNDTHPA